MNNEDLWAGLGATISTVISGLSWFFEIGVLQALFPFIAGAFVTFFVQSKLQDRSEKRKLIVKAIEELHIPLFLEVESIKEELIQDLESGGIGSWHTLVKKPQMFTIEYELRKRLLNLFERSKDITDSLGTVKSLVTAIIYKNVEEQLFPALKEKGLVKLEMGMHARAENLNIDHWRDGIGFGLQLKNPHMTFEAPIAVCAILNRDPIDYLEKERKKFEIDQIILFIKVSYRLGARIKEQNFNIPMKEQAELFRTFWRKIIKEVHENGDIIAFNNTRSELAPISKDISSRLKKHIEKYVVTERI